MRCGRNRSTASQCAQGRNNGARVAIRSRELDLTLDKDSPREGAGFEPSVPLRDRGTLQLYSELFDPMIATHYGRLVKTIGDGFSSSSAVVDALRCASQMQGCTAELDTPDPVAENLATY